eukprot:gene11667-24437_t
MMLSSMLPTLPAPRHQYETLDESFSEEFNTAIVVPRVKEVPPYLSRNNFIPFSNDDFGDGGAFPEIHVVQYPLDMGRPGSKSSAVVAVDLDEKGQVRFDAIVKQGVNKDKLIKTSLEDMKGSEGVETLLTMPEVDEEQETAERTRKALEALLDGKIMKAKPSTVLTSAGAEEPTYIRYTPNPNAPGFNPAAKQRVIRMVEAQIDPMEPPKHKYKKTVRGPPSPPVPVLHSPPRKLTVKDQQEWKIPPCVSNWKNARGYTIPLDKRLAADGRGLQEVTINNKFAGLSESLYVAERKAAEDLRLRNQLRKKMSMREKEDKEKDLRDMALKARMERAGVDVDAGMGVENRTEHEEEENDQEEEHRYKSSSSSSRGYGGGVGGGYEKEKLDDVIETEGGGSGGGGRGWGNDDNNGNNDRGGSGSGHYGRVRNEDRDEGRRDRGRDGRDRDGSGGRGWANDDNSDNDNDKYSGNRDNKESSPSGTETDRQAKLQREALRIDRRKEREREIRLDNMKGKMRLGKVDRDDNRDVSEKIALGMLRGSAKLTGEAMYDSRLFNQSAGMDSGFGAEDEYSTYSKPLFDRGEGGSSVYRPKRDDVEVYGDVDTQMAKLSDTSRFKADKDRGFKGTEGGGQKGGMGRDAPVQFERGGGGNDRDRDDDDRDYSRGSSGGHSDRRDRDRDGNGNNKNGKGEDPFGIDDIVKEDRRDRNRDSTNRDRDRDGDRDRKRSRRE